MKSKVLKYFFVLFAIVIFMAGIGAGLFYYYSKELPPLSVLQQYEMKVGSEVYDRNDNLIHIFSVERRQLTRLDELPQYLKDGMLAVEDKNFYDHWGMDLYGFTRAIVKDIQHLNFSQGASTITQQLARNMFLSLDKKITRKIKELILAVQVERHFSKDEILEMYFNKAPFGPGLYGIEIASARYFDKKAKDLTIPEAALIIGMPQLPSAYYPYRHPEKAMRRRNIVLGRMLEENVITTPEYQAAIADTMLLTRSREKRSSDDYFISYIRPQLERKYGTTQLFTGGLKIYTTLDSELQAYADSVLNAQLIKFEKKNSYEVKYEDFPVDTTDIKTEYVQGGVFSIEPETGHVRVLIGGRNCNHSKFNRMMQANRQPGSSFKPILYTTAIVNGYTASTVIQDEPISFIYSDTLFWSVKNYSRTNYGYTRLRDGLRKSRNIFSTKTLYDVGPKKLVDYAKRFGISSRLYPIYPLAVGSIEVKPYEMITAYTTFPNGGERVKPIFIRRVEDSTGKILEVNNTEKIRVVEKPVAELMVNLMKSVTESGGTGAGIRWQPKAGEFPSISYKWDAAGKTGTTDDFRDGWFIGYNKKLVTGIWVGFDDFSSLGARQSGAVAAVPAWPFIMKKSIQLDSPKNSSGRPIVDSSLYQFDEPTGLVKVKISKETGLLPKNAFEETIEEYFIPGTQPSPLSDSLNYNFMPTIYRENEMDSLVFDLGGRRYTWPDSVTYEVNLINFTERDSLEPYPPIILTDVDSLLYVLGGEEFKLPEYVQSLHIVPDSLDNNFFHYDFEPDIYAQDEIEAVTYYLGGTGHKWPDEVMWQREHQPEHIDLRGAKIIKDHKYVERPDSLLWWEWARDSTMVNDSLATPVITPLDSLMNSIIKED